MTLQYTEHPTPKIWLLVNFPEKEENGKLCRFHVNCRASRLDGDPDPCTCLSKCERIEVTNPENILVGNAPCPIYFLYGNKFFHNGSNIEVKDGDTFEIDDEKVSVEIDQTMLVSESSGIGFKKIATLKLKETVKEDKEPLTFESLQKSWGDSTCGRSVEQYIFDKMTEELNKLKK